MNQKLFSDMGKISQRSRFPSMRWESNFVRTAGLALFPYKLAVAPLPCGHFQ
jgi:hypothetical protein